MVSAEGFIGSIKSLAVLFNVPVIIISLILVPIATELPEKFNSIIWINKSKDTLAMGNITGALVFQSTILPALAILNSAWKLDNHVFISLMLTLIAVLWLKFSFRYKTLPINYLLLNGALYVIYLGLIFNL